ASRDSRGHNTPQSPTYGFTYSTRLYNQASLKSTVLSPYTYAVCRHHQTHPMRPHTQAFHKTESREPAHRASPSNALRFSHAGAHLPSNHSHISCRGDLSIPPFFPL